MSNGGRVAVDPEGRRWLLPSGTDLSTLKPGVIPPGAVPAPAREARTAMMTAAQPPAEFAGAPFQPKTALGAGVLETLGLGSRAGAKTPVQVLTKPEGAAERVTQAAVEMPLIMLGGALMPAAALPAWIGRIAMSGALGGAKAAAKDQSIPTGALLDLAASSLGEAIPGGIASRLAKRQGIPKAMEEFAGKAAAYKWATEAPSKALAALKHRLPKDAKIVVPSIDPAKKIPLEQAVEELGKREGPAYQVLYSEIVDWINRLELSKRAMGTTTVPAGVRQTAERVAKQLGTTVDDPMVRKMLEGMKVIPPGGALPVAAEAAAAPSKSAGELFAGATSPFRAAPTPVTARGAARALQAPALRSAVDVAATEDVGGMPAALPLAAVAGQALDPRRALRLITP